jgi:hypothetical protein
MAQCARFVDEKVSAYAKIRTNAGGTENASGSSDHKIRVRATIG